MTLSVNFKRMIAFILFCAVFASVCSVIAKFTRRVDPDKQNSQEQTTTSPHASLPTVIIDAGHGGEDGGAIGINGCIEKDLNLAIALSLEEMLRSSGVKTVLTRNTDTLLYDRNSNYQGQKKKQDAEARLLIAEKYEDAVFVSIHMNSFPQAKYKGLQVYYSPNSKSSSALANKIQETVAKNLQPNNNRRVKESGENIYLLYKLKHPAVLIECGFLSNPEECAMLCDENYQQRLCASIHAAILGFLKENSSVSE